MSQANQEFSGSCHCGFIKYTVALTPEQLSDPVAYRCNCTWCQKGCMTIYRPPASAFKLISPASKAELPDYSPKGQEGIKMHRYFCNMCGGRVFNEGTYPSPDGKVVELFSINLSTLDQPQDGLELNKFKIMYVDGKHDNFAGGAKDQPWEEGLP